MDSSDSINQVLNEPFNIAHCTMHPQTDPDHVISSLECFKKSRPKLLIFAVISILTGGFVFLLALWFIRLRVYLLFNKSSPSEATHLLVNTRYDQDLIPVTVGAKGRMFYHRFMPFYFTKTKIKPLYFRTAVRCSELVSCSGLTSEQYEQQKLRFGRCEIIVPIKPIPLMLIQDILSPFFVFQLFSVALWIYQDYTTYAYVIIGMTTISLTTNLITTRRSVIKIRDMVYSEGTATVVRDGQTIAVDKAELVPGDVMIVTSNCVMPCDAVMLQGNCVMEEGMLTGETVPVLKDSLPNSEESIYDIEKDKRFSLYEGTKVIQSRGLNNGALALVTRSGYQTLKGKLVRTILFPKPTKFKFYRDSLLFVSVLGIIALSGFIVIIPSLVNQGYDGLYIFLQLLNLITIAIPPVLPTAMAAGVTFGLYFLSKDSIWCIAPQRINTAGKISTMIFDKTGTLTVEGMELIGVRHASSFDRLDLKAKGKMQENMATCHSLTQIDGVIMGDTQDLNIFQSTGADFELTDFGGALAHVVICRKDDADDLEQSISTTDIKESGELDIMHVFHFTSEQKRMGVIVRNQNTEAYEAHLKGAPEVMKELCMPDSVPDDFDEVLSEYTQMGYRVLACASRNLPDCSSINFKKYSLTDFEEELKFIGLIVLQNKLKPETNPTLNKLRVADIKIKMATGDNVLTGVAVGRECGIIPVERDVYLCEYIKGSLQWTYIAYEALDKGQIPVVVPEIIEDEAPWRNRNEPCVLASTGEALYQIVKSGDAFLTDELVMRGAVFARMAPEHKTLLIEQLQARNKLVGMCGDGANDCGALKTADIGISLCEAEASIAAPFTSGIPNISCVEILLRRGRCALTTSLQNFKFIALYSMIQYMQALIMNWYGIGLTNWQYIYEDLFIVFPITISLGFTSAARTLKKRRPVGSLMSVAVIGSIIGQTLLITLCQAACLLLIISKPYYVEVNSNDLTGGMDDQYYQWENTAIYPPGLFELVAIFFVFHTSKPFKRPIWTNYYLTVHMLFWIATILYLMIDPDDWLRHLFGVKFLPWQDRWEILAICFGFFLASFIYDRYFVEWLHQYFKRRKRRNKVNYNA